MEGLVRTSKDLMIKVRTGVGSNMRGHLKQKRFLDLTFFSNSDYRRKGAEKKRRKGAIKDSDKIFKQLSKEAAAPGGNSERK